MPVESSTSWTLRAQSFAGALLDAEKPAPEFMTSAFGINDARRFAVYKNNVVVSLVRALESNFPAIAKLVGAENFINLARVFVEKYPPKSRIMARYGAEFPAFLDAFEPLAAYPYLGDVARIEQAWREAFHETDAQPLSVADFVAVAPDSLSELVFVVHPAARLLKSSYAAGSIFSANRGGAMEKPIDPRAGEYTLVTRPHYECSMRVLSACDGTFIAALMQGATLGEAAQAALEVDVGFDLAANISMILEAGVFCSFSIG